MLIICITVRQGVQRKNQILRRSRKRQSECDKSILNPKLIFSKWAVCKNFDERKKYGEKHCIRNKDQYRLMRWKKKKSWTLLLLHSVNYYFMCKNAISKCRDTSMRLVPDFCICSARRLAVLKTLPYTKKNNTKRISTCPSSVWNAQILDFTWSKCVTFLHSSSSEPLSVQKNGKQMTMRIKRRAMFGMWELGCILYLNYQRIPES